MRNHQRAYDSLKAFLENESKSKNALLIHKKKLETNINDLELSLSMVNKSNIDAQKSIKKKTAKIQELQLQVDEEQKLQDEVRENYLTTDRQLANVSVEKGELNTQREHLEQSKQRMELDLTDQRAQNQDLLSKNMQITAAQRIVENEIELTKVIPQKKFNYFIIFFRKN